MPPLDRFFRPGSASDIIARANRAAGQARPAPKPAPKPKPKPKTPTRPQPAPIARAVRQVGTTATRAATTTRRTTRSASRVAVARARDPVIARGDALYRQARAAAMQEQIRRDRMDVNAPPETPDQVALARALRRAYAIGPGQELLGGRLEGVARAADPAITFTEKVTRPFTMPASVTANLIAGDVKNAAAQLATLTYKGKYRWPSEELNKRGWLPGGAAGLLLGLGADTLPAAALPGLKGSGRAAGTQAARQLSRRQRLPRSEAKPVPYQDRAANLPARATRRQQRAVRLQPGRGPDIITTPRARVVPQRPVTGGGAVRGGRPRPATRPGRVAGRRRTLDQMPYAPTPRAQRAADRLRVARDEYGRITARQPTRLQAARAGRTLGRAEGALRAAEQATIGRIRRTAPTLTSTQRAQIEARLPGGATRAGARTAALRDYGRRGPDLPSPRQATPRRGLPPAVKPADVPYSPIPAAVARLNEAKQAAQQAVRAKEPDPKQLAHLRGRVDQAKQLVERAVARGGNPRGYEANLRVQVNRLDRFLAMTPNPSRQQLVRVGRVLEAMTLEAAAAEARVAGAITAGRAAMRRPTTPARPAPTARQVRATRPGSQPGVVFDTRPRTVTELRRSSTTPLEGRNLPRLRHKVNQATGRVETVIRRGPTEKQIGAAGKALAKAEERRRKAERAIWRRKSDGRFTRPDPTGRQKDLHREAFTGSRPREWIDANMEYEATLRQVMSETPIGINITAPWNRRGKGVSIPVMTRSASTKVRDFLTSGKLGEAVTAYRQWVVSRYGPNPVVRVGALAADDVTRMQSAQSAKFVRDETRKAGLTEDELILASHWLEGTTYRPVPDKVKRYAEKMAQFTERNADEFVQAGGVLKRFGENGKLDGGLDRQYVYHMLPHDEWDDFAVSSLAKRQILYGRRPGFTKQRKVLTIVDLKKAGFHPVERLDELTFARAMAHHRAMSDMELSRSVARRFGRKADEAPDNWQRVPSQFVDADVVVPPDVARTLRSVIEARLALPRNKASARLQGLNQRWKEWALLTLGYDIRNQFGDSALVFQATANPVAPILALTFGAKTLTGKGRVGGRSRYTSAQARELADTAGMREAGLFGADILSDVASVEAQGVKAVTRSRRLRHPIHTAMRGVRRARTGRESLNRTGIFARELRKGEGPVHAARVAKDTVYDYGDVGKAVQWARSSPVGAPFLTWTAKNLPRQIQLTVQNPAQAAMTLSALESLERQSGDWPRFLVPEWFRSRMPVAIPGRGRYSFDLPMGSLNLLPPGTTRTEQGIPIPSGLGNVAREWYGQLAPLVQAPIALFGTNPTTGREFRDVRPANTVEQVLQRFGGPLMQALLGSPDRVLSRDETGEQRPVPAVSDRGSWFLNQLLPGVGTAGRIVPAEGRDPVRQLRGPVMGHQQRDFFDPVAAASQFRGLRYRVTRELIPEFNRRMEALAPNWRQGDPIPPQLRRKYAEIQRLMAQAEIIKALMPPGQQQLLE